MRKYTYLLSPGILSQPYNLKKSLSGWKEDKLGARNILDTTDWVAPFLGTNSKEIFKPVQIDR